MEIIDNINRLLGDDLKQTLKPGARLKVAASCFSIYALEALKAGQYDVRLENSSKAWATSYDSPALRQGLLKKEEIANELPRGMQGFKTILATESSHPYIASWWPPGHIVGYEHTFVHEVADFLRALEEDREIEPNFEDGLKCMEVLDAAALSAREGRKVEVAGGRR